MRRGRERGLGGKRGTLRITTFTLVLAIILLSSGFGGGSDTSYSDEVSEGGALFLISVDENNRVMLDKLGIEVEEDYGSFILAHLRQAERNLLKRKGVALSDQTYSGRISLGCVDFDVRDAPKGPALPGNLKMEYAADEGYGFYLAKFKGPVKEEWLEDLEARGINIYDYIPHNAYLVGAEPGITPEIEKMNSVEWTGIFHPAYKISPALNDMLNEGKGSDAVRVRILLFDTGEQESLSQSFQDLSPYLDKFYGSYSQRDYLCAEAAVKKKSVDNIARNKGVRWIECLTESRLEDEISTEISGGTYEPNDGAYVHSLGYDGSGVTVAVVDTGWDNGTDINTHADLSGRIKKLIDYTETDTSDGVAEDRDNHGTHVAGIIAGSGATGTYDGDGYLYGMGVAPGAELVIQRKFDDDGSDAFSGPWKILTQDSVRNEATIQSNSWGNWLSVSYGGMEQEYDALVRDADPENHGCQQLTIVFSAGNRGDNGAGSLTMPKAAKNLIAVGASENYRPDLGSIGSTNADNVNHLAKFSSRGPTEDYRIKPDLAAPGTLVASLRSWYGTNALYGYIDSNYLWCSGTSQSAPHVSGAAAVFTQYYRGMKGNTPSPAMIKAALINGADDMYVALPPQKPGEELATPPIPNYYEGWGRLNLTNVIENGQAMNYIDQKVSLEVGEVYSIKADLGSTSEPLKVTLVWTDKEGAVGANPALVNDLDLKVTAPDGTIFKGNVFYEGWTDPDDATYANPDWDVDSDGYDEKNNVECVYINTSAVQAGTYTINVTAAAINGEGNPNTPEMDQDFALVIYNGADTTPPDHTNEFPAVGGTTYYVCPTISVNVTDYGLVDGESIRLYVNGFSVAYSLEEIGKGYNVSYTHENGFSNGDVVDVRIVAKDLVGNTLDFNWQFTVDIDSIVQIGLHRGWNLISIPLNQTDESLFTVLSSVSEKYDMVQWYDASETTQNRWKVWYSSKPAHMCPLLWLNKTMGVWINVTEDDVVLEITGDPPNPTVIDLYEGWNLVGYPSLTSGINVATALSGIPYIRVKTYDELREDRLRLLDDFEFMVPARGYWVYVTSDCQWTVDW